MKFKPWLMLLLATFLMAAAPPSRPPATPSAWDKIKSSAKRLLPHPEAPKPLTQRKVQAPPRAGASANRSASELSAQEPAVRRDPQVQQATAIEKPAPRAAAASRPQQRKPVKPSLFSREKRPTRTLSQYMAEEKP
jgi:hypothetical protein